MRYKSPLLDHLRSNLRRLGSAVSPVRRKAAYVGRGDSFVVNMALDRPLSAGAGVMLKLANHGVVPIAGA